MGIESSGLNYKRKNFFTSDGAGGMGRDLRDHCRHKDRLVRFGFEWPLEVLLLS
ncbi:hypothetical protein MFUM_130004 [Methylacidiphilum fumariolicum SolV]|uniref:Uncharacterized protein n=1 Tax=Methylacidiphilum fumariolicum (strain SolV) TaxID=1156937 RepID=I0JWC1_METFB|nr:hypothetical protein MFUM_130004 [Methylacidiphilum fumariolicum SolV]